VVLFLISKIFYIGNVVGQLFLLNLVLATKYNTFGFEVVRDLIANRDWTEQSYVAFPRVTLCDFKVSPSTSFWPHQMHEMRTSVIDDLAVSASVGLSVTRATVLTHSPDGATSMRPLLPLVELLAYCSQMAGLAHAAGNKTKNSYE